MRHKTCVNARRLLQRAGWMPEFVAIEVRRRRKIPARVKDLKVRQVRRWRAAASAGSAIGEPGGGKPGHGEPQGHGVPPQTRRTSHHRRDGRWRPAVHHLYAGHGRLQ